MHIRPSLGGYICDHCFLQSPCADHRHLEIWTSGKNCSRLPNFLIVGPQKTGSTALASFLSYHPLLVVNDNNPVTFEEVQFFSDDQNYHKGIEWLGTYSVCFSCMYVMHNAVCNIWNCICVSIYVSIKWLYVCIIKGMLSYIAHNIGIWVTFVIQQKTNYCLKRAPHISLIRWHHPGQLSCCLRLRSSSFFMIQWPGLTPGTRWGIFRVTFSKTQLKVIFK